MWQHWCRMAAVVFWLLLLMLFVVIQPADSIFGPWKELLTEKNI
jgi:predicted exporter